jgi:hypothetical protein
LLPGLAMKKGHFPVHQPGVVEPAPGLIAVSPEQPVVYTHAVVALHQHFFPHFFFLY